MGAGPSREENRALIDEFRAHKGRVASFGDTPVLLLTTTGARSGAARVNPLVPLVEGDRLYVFAAAAGAATSPAWYTNAVAHPEVGVEFGAEQFRAVAVPVDGPERDRVFAAQVARQPEYARYQEEAGDRLIPVVELRRI
jgi:deazaflavin-dependent oxidoreductase (nitroreductase family)